ncbi:MULTISPECIES: AMP nucleosidase [Methylobacterium]|uniref:AMP nucleosidase n=1 Tax=Methylobacterium thuringiense TaxID=1003091 RepID=A0ABQ4TM00_9HYPH|nr:MULTISPECIES: AMP nucleosidase [Methylobacterium]TXN20250.1 AMP nucleosidase [Methylobacterium sp. WL9]GJE56383.1 AMP nucleosidase [Methylobacterium thuringiense]
MDSEELRPMAEIADPETAVDRLTDLFDGATAALRTALKRYLDDGVPPDATERLQFRYPELRLTYRADGPVPRINRATAKFQAPGTYATTLTQPGHFRPYLLEQLRHLVRDYGATLEVGLSGQEIPYSYVVEPGADLTRNGVTASQLATYFPTPLLSVVGDEIADGLWQDHPDAPRPLALFDGVRTDYSLRRLVHYTGSDWREIQPWILLTNYHRYVDGFVRHGLDRLTAPDSVFEKLVLPGGISVSRAEAATADPDALIAASPWHRFQMPAYHLVARGADGSPQGTTLVNIGVGPSNAKTITDHLAVLRPHCWLMVGHCGGLRQSQTIGDYVLAHGYLRLDRILDDLVPPEVPVPALAEVQIALQNAAAAVTGEQDDALKRRLRTGTVVTYDDRNWELRFTQERRRINLGRCIAVDMESGTVAAQGYRLRVPYGTLLCVSDKPLHGEIKLPGAANAFYERAVAEHLLIGLATLDALRADRHGLHSRKLRSFDEPPFR